MDLKPRKALIILCLLVVILTTFLFVSIRLLARNPDEETWFNHTLRPHLASSPALRTILGLHFDGDARSDYLGTRSVKIIVEIDAESGLTLFPQAEQELVYAMHATTGKEIEIVHSSELTPTPGGYSDNIVVELAEQHQRYHSTHDAAVFYILVLSRSSGDEPIVGRTVQEDAAVIYEDPLSHLPGAQQALAQASTLLHEFGHQLGLPHNDHPGCLMNPEAEAGDFGTGGNLTTQFCAIEQQQLLVIKQTIN
ncbi:MAG: hypothetical protein A2722_00820 [Candidatus Doudnabacteria bacterium RIFCSPHIGHO2_01_FULL_50_11]|uniref:Uncharacterized protein n=1 Tax=Candidatus Doudnabacteria bacterium RIFCSPHIGHO2_01_FULL_50_11 TaxID=1817828 RepID=A0A1F5PGG1_9BACT|nr:MAG: hypothetical protein A2722_00820 [Candidatus Doudnabacteria bacterium RIFCSPHIGHO2_01_FULL_50_11]HLC44984.1 hypothetical protein [Patescibacteria group bacterium]